MTKQELIAKMGNEDRANWVMEELLRNVKPEFIRMMLKAKADNMDEKIKHREANGYYMDDTKFPEDFNVFSYELAIESGNDDGTKAEALRLYDEYNQRQLEKASDQRTKNFYHNMRAEFNSH